MATVTTTTTTTSPGLGISIDKSYVHTLFGKLNLLTLVANIICFICVASMSYLYNPSSGWFYFVCVTGFWTGLIEFFLGLCHIQDRMVRVVPWKLGTLIFCALWCFFYLTAASAVTSFAVNHVNAGGWYAGAFFGFIAMIVYGFSAYYRYQDWRGVSPTNPA